MRSLILFLSIFAASVAFAEEKVTVDTYLLKDISTKDQTFNVERYVIPSQEMGSEGKEISRALNSTQLKYYETANKSDMQPYLLLFMVYDNNYSVLVCKDEESELKFHTVDGKTFSSITEVVNERYGDISIYEELKKCSDIEAKNRFINPSTLRFVSHSNIKERLEGLMDRGAAVWIAGKSLYDGQSIVGTGKTSTDMLSSYSMRVYELTDEKIKLKASMKTPSDEIYSYLELDYDQALENFVFVALGGQSVSN